jgi:hypothetical protein
MITIKDFNKRVNKNIPWMFNYEYRVDDKVYSIYKMSPSSMEVSIETKAHGGGFWKDIEPKEIESIDEGLEIINEFIKEQTK